LWSLRARHPERSEAKSREPVPLPRSPDWAQGVHFRKQVASLRISSCNERFVFRAAPALELFFSRYRAGWIPVRLEINELVGVVLPSKCASESERVFARPPFKTVRNTNIQDAMAISIRQHVNEVILILHL